MQLCNLHKIPSLPIYVYLQKYTYIYTGMLTKMKIGY